MSSIPLDTIANILNRSYWLRCSTLDLVSELECTAANLDSDSEGTTWWQHQIAGLQAEIERRQRQPLYTVSSSSKITKELVDEIKAKTDLAALMSHGLKLIGPTSDGHYRAVCPFHTERRPSLTVYNKEGRYYCFGCQATGDAIHWLMASHNLTFRQAVEQLAGATGVVLPEVRIERKLSGAVAVLQ